MGRRPGDGVDRTPPRDACCGSPGRMTDTAPDIVVAGAGPVGLAAALLLDAAGHRVALVAPPRTGADHRTSALMAGSVSLLERLGIWPDLAARAAPLRTLRIVDATGRLIRAPEVAFHAGEIGLDAFGYNMPQRRARRARLRAAVDRSRHPAPVRPHRGRRAGRSRRDRGPVRRHAPAGEAHRRRRRARVPRPRGHRHPGQGVALRPGCPRPQSPPHGSPRRHLDRISHTGGALHPGALARRSLEPRLGRPPRGNRPALRPRRRRHSPPKSSAAPPRSSAPSPSTAPARSFPLPA